MCGRIFESSERNVWVDLVVRIEAMCSNHTKRRNHGGFEHHREVLISINDVSNLEVDILCAVPALVYVPDDAGPA
jgi:hypothetical protein